MDIYFYNNYIAVKINEQELQVCGDAQNIKMNGKRKLPKNTYTTISFK